MCHLEYYLYTNKYIDNNVNKDFIAKTRDSIQKSNIEVLATKNGIVKEVKIIVIKKYIKEILFKLGGINYV